MTMDKTVGLYITLVATCIIGSLASLQCITQKNCYCQQTENEYIDLEPIGNFVFRAIDASGTYKYVFRLCHLLNFTGNCSDVYGCQYQDIPGFYYDIASNPPEFIDIRTIRYNTSTNRTTLINVECFNEKFDFSLVSEDKPSTTVFLLKTQYACPKVMPSTTTQTTNATTQDTNSTTTSHSTNTTASSPTTHPTNTTASSTTVSSSTSSSPSTTSSVKTSVTTAKITSTTPNTASTQRSTRLGLGMIAFWLFTKHYLL